MAKSEVCLVRICGRKKRKDGTAKKVREYAIEK